MPPIVTLEVVRQDGRHEVALRQVMNEIAPDDARLDVHREVRLIHRADAVHRLHLDEHAVLADRKLRLRVRAPRLVRCSLCFRQKRDERDDVASASAG